MWCVSHSMLVLASPGGTMPSSNLPCAVRVPGTLLPPSERSIVSGLLLRATQRMISANDCACTARPCQIGATEMTFGHPSALLSHFQRPRSRRFGGPGTSSAIDLGSARVPGLQAVASSHWPNYGVLMRRASSIPSISAKYRVRADPARG